jgi:hypothetical protein
MNTAAYETSGDGLSPYIDDFKRIVLAHIKNQLGAEEWQRLVADKDRDFENPEPFLDEYFDRAGISVAEVIKHFEMVPIGEIKDQPVYYAPGKGIYQWGQSLDNPWSLMFWVSSPACPKGW